MSIIYEKVYLDYPVRLGEGNALFVSYKGMIYPMPLTDVDMEIDYVVLAIDTTGLLAAKPLYPWEVKQDERACDWQRI